jgi:hypothetical protein
MLIAEGLSAENAAKLGALPNGFGRFIESVRFSRSNKESAAPMLQNLMQSSQQLTAAVGAEFFGNEDVKGILNALTDSVAKLLDAFVLLNQNLEVHLKLRDLVYVTASFLRAVRWPLVLAAVWSRLPIENWRFIPVPTLSEYGHSRGVNVLMAYQHMKTGVVRLAALLYPGLPSIAERIDSTM